MPTLGQQNLGSEGGTSDKDIQAHLDHESQKHMMDSSSLSYIIEWLFKHQDKLPDGTTKEQAGQMTQYKQIELLEKINSNPAFLDNTDVPHTEIASFLETVNKAGFRTADDF